MPQAVLESAQVRLQQLEQQQAAHPQQSDLFAQSQPTAPPGDAASANEYETQYRPLVERIAAQDVDALTPKQALLLLYELKQLVSGRDD